MYKLLCTIAFQCNFSFSFEIIFFFLAFKCSSFQTWICTVFIQVGKIVEPSLMIIENKKLAHLIPFTSSFTKTFSGKVDL